MDGTTVQSFYMTLQSRLMSFKFPKFTGPLISGDSMAGTRITHYWQDTAFSRNARSTNSKLPEYFLKPIVTKTVRQRLQKTP